MVTETVNAGRIFDRMTDSFRTAFDMGRRTQDAWFKTVGEAWTRFPGDGQRLLGEWTPFFTRQMETAVQACDATFRSGLDVFKAAVEATARPGEADPYETARHFWDTAFGAARLNFDAIGQAGAKAMDECATFCESFWRQESAPRRSAQGPTQGPQRTSKAGE